MPKERVLSLGKYDISANRYLELKYFCRQYREKQSQLRSLTEISSYSSDGRGGSGISDKTASLAIKRTQLKEELKLVEQSAYEADKGIYQYIISNVADGVPYEYLGVPTGRRQFYEARRRFFFLLSQKKG